MIWKEIKGFEDYEISNCGKIRRIKNSKLLKLYLNNTGYLQLTLYKNKVPFKKKVHKLVAENFLEHIPSGMSEVVDHIDGNRLNNHVNNLRITTQRINNLEARKRNATKRKFSSKCRGVSFYQSSQKWIAAVYVNGEKRYLGAFATEKEACEEYSKALQNL